MGCKGSKSAEIARVKSVPVATITTVDVAKKTVESPKIAMEPVQAKTVQFKAGDIVWYRNAEGEEEPVGIVAVHFDDFPNVYYTIFLHSTKREKQTDSRRLRAVETPDVGQSPGESSSLSGIGGGSVAEDDPNKDTWRDVGGAADGMKVDNGGDSENAATGPTDTSQVEGAFTVQITHGSRKYSVGGVHTKMIIRELKELVATVVGVAIPAQKLICKGRVLLDHQCVEDVNISEGAKIMLMGSPPR